MTKAGMVRQMEIEDLKRAKELAQTILRDWDWMTWNELLADDIVFSLRLGAVGINRAGDISTAGGNLQVIGREEATHVLKSIYGELRSGLAITTQMGSAYDVALLGKLTLHSTKKNTEALCVPMVLHMAFDDDGRVERTTIAEIDLHPLADTILGAAQDGGGHAG